MFMLSRNRQLIVILFLIFDFGRSVHSSHTNLQRIHRDKIHEKLLRRTLISLGKVVDFFAKEYKKFNIDGIFGLQALDGILQDLLTKVETSRIQIPKRTFQVLTRLHHKAKLVSSKSQPYLRASDPDYYRLGFVARHAWLFQREFRNLNTSLSQIKPQDVENGHFDMYTMDQCISELIGDQISGAKPCNITDECWNFVRSENTTGYMTTHQALYLMVGEIKGCLPNITKLLSSSQKEGERSIEIIFETLCASIYKQMRWREIVFRRKQQSKHADDKDLYMEQCYVCGILGYHQQFLSLDRLSAVLDWQLPPGCYGSSESPKGGHRGTEDSNVYREQWDHEDLNDDDFNDGFGLNPTRDLDERITRDRSSNGLPGGCQRHITGVATGLLGVYLKWLLMEPPLTPAHHH